MGANQAILSTWSTEYFNTTLFQSYVTSFLSISLFPDLQVNGPFRVGAPRHQAKRVLRDFWWFIRHLSSIVKSTGLNEFCYLQVPGSIPAENTSTQIHMDLSK